MKQRAFQIAVDKGYTSKTAAPFWQKVKDNCGAEPTAAMLADYDQAAYEKAGVAPPLAKAWSEAFRVVKKGKFRPGKPYSPKEYVTFYIANPKDEVLVAAINLACDNKPWVVYTDKYHPEQMAQFIGWHINEDNAPATIDVNGEPVTPVMPGEEKVEKVKLYWVDPHTPGEFLTVEMKSRRTGADFTGYVKDMGTTNEDTSAFQAMIFLCGRDLKSETPLSLRRHTDDCRGATARDILADFDETLAAWNKLPADQRPKAKLAKEKAAVPFADAAPAAAPAAPVFQIPNDSPFVALPHSTVLNLSSVLVRLGIMTHRAALVSGFNPSYRLKTHEDEMTQAIIDLSRLSNDGRLTDGTVPLRQYLTVALSFASQRPEAVIIYAALLATFAPESPIPTVIPQSKYNVNITGSNIGSISVGGTPNATGNIAVPAVRAGVPIVHFLTANKTKAVQAAEELKMYLSSARRNNEVVLTDDYTSHGGDNIAILRAQRLNAASIVIAMICADTIADDDFDATLKCGKRMIPVIVSACDWKSIPSIGGMVPLNLDSGQATVAEGIMGVVRRRRIG